MNHWFNFLAKIGSFSGFTALWLFCYTGLIAQNTVSNNQVLFWLKVNEDISPATERYIKIALAEAQKTKAAYVLLELNTFGGRVDNADAIRQLLLEHPQPVLVFINKNAASAGALISLACDSIYMATGATIGAATVVTSDGNKASGKYQSYMAEKMRATAEANRRNPEIAAAMVDEKIQVDSLQNGKVLTLTSQRALSKGYCEAIVDNEQQILARLQLKPSQVVRYAPSWLELIIRFFMHPIVSSLLLLLIMAGLFLELKAPGAGFPIVLAVTSAVLYFVPYYLYGLAQNWELVLLFLGIVMLLVELFVIPGFGVLGIAGLIVTLGALVLVMLDNKWFDFSEVNTMDIFNAVFVVGVAITGAVVLLIIGLPMVFKSKRFKAISLQKSMNRELGYNSGTLNKRLVGQEGITYTVLRPSGKIMVENELYDASTRGDYIEKGEKVIIIQQNGPTAIVKKATEE